MQTRAGTVRELLRSSGLKDFGFSQFRSLPLTLPWKVHSVQFNQVPLISKVQIIQF